jgi:flagellar biosynthetic protein FliP
MTTTHNVETVTAGPTRAPWRPLARHYVEMVIAMFAGMIVLGGLRAVLGLTVPFEEQPGTAYLLMAIDMSIGMAAWMRYRGDGWAGTLEMCAAMFVPLALTPLVWADLMGAMAFMTVAHVVMLVAMLAVLLRRRDEHAHH